MTLPLWLDGVVDEAVVWREVPDDVEDVESIERCDCDEVSETDV